MDENSIRKYASLMRELGLTGLEIDKDGGVVRLEMGGAAAPAVVSAAPAVQAAPVAPAGKGSCITSPMVGVFYAAPAENAAPYVKVGDSVRRGDVLCIIEAMKLMNEITAELDGVITEVCAENGQVVDFGCPLFRIKGEAEL